MKQQNLFNTHSLNPTYEIKRRIRIALSGVHHSRDEVADRMNEVAVREGMRQTISRQTLDNWAKDSDPGRLPSPAWLTIFCFVTGDTGPIEAMVKPLEWEILDQEQVRILRWGKAELAKRRASKQARIALEALES